VPNFIKEHVNANFQILGTALNLFSMEDNKNPIAIQWQEQPPLKTIFYLYFTNEKLKHMLNPFFPLWKGLSFTFMLSLHLLSLCIDYESIVVILSIMCIVPKFIIDWFMIMVLLVLKLFLSSHPFELWRCPMHLCFATPRGTSWIPLCHVFSMLKTNK
jgi:hypothetical protein